MVLGVLGLQQLARTVIPCLQAQRYRDAQLVKILRALKSRKNKVGTWRSNINRQWRPKKSLLSLFCSRCRTPFDVSISTRNDFLRLVAGDLYSCHLAQKT
ncbi:hypothetical protein TNCV_1764741 [Trichonephila clavipes]|nr:hypothetical protein TNCV_1764741 [Trichonephila clavipes]